MLTRRIVEALACLLLMSSIARCAEPKPAKILLIATPPDHKYTMHMYAFECNLLAKCLNQNAGVEAVVSSDLVWPADSHALDDVKSIVFYTRPAGDIVLGREHRAQAEKLLRSGVGLSVIHWATAANVNLGEDWLPIAGGWFNFAHCKLKIQTQPLHMLDPEHPICRGWKPYDLHDEFYLHMKFFDRAQPLLSVTVDDQPQTVAWTLERPESNHGRTFGTTLGHFHENFGIPAFRCFLVNGILWSAHVDVPADGAKVDVTEADLELPPAPPEEPKEKPAKKKS